jgi:hypothetical protein
MENSTGDGRGEIKLFMIRVLTTYWIEFGTLYEMQYGVTAYSLDDAIFLLQQKVFRTDKIPAARNVIENIKVIDLDQNHIVPNMGLITERGIWFPNLFGC